MIPIKKRLLSEAKDDMEKQIIEEILSEMPIDLIEFQQGINAKKMRLRNWRERSGVKLKPTNGEKRQIRRAHQLLGVSPPRKGQKAPIVAIKKAFKAKARSTHPDYFPDREKDFIAAQKAYVLLINHYKEEEGA